MVLALAAVRCCLRGPALALRRVPSRCWWVGAPLSHLYLASSVLPLLTDAQFEVRTLFRVLIIKWLWLGRRVLGRRKWSYKVQSCVFLRERCKCECFFCSELLHTSYKPVLFLGQENGHHWPDMCWRHALICHNLLWTILNVKCDRSSSRVYYLYWHSVKGWLFLTVMIVQASFQLF